MKNPVDEAEILLQTFPGLLAGRCPGWQGSLLAEALLRWTTRWRPRAPVVCRRTTGGRGDCRGNSSSRGRVLKETGPHTANYNGNPETHWLGSDAPLSSLSRMLSRHLLELVSLTICPQPLKHPRTSQGRGPAWLVASELLAEQCGTESRLQSSGRDSKKHSQLQENSGHGRAEGQPVSSGPRWTCLRFTWG